MYCQEIRTVGLEPTLREVRSIFRTERNQERRLGGQGGGDRESWVQTAEGGSDEQEFSKVDVCRELAEEATQRCDIFGLGKRANLDGVCSVPVQRVRRKDIKPQQAQIRLVGC